TAHLLLGITGLPVLPLVEDGVDADGGFAGLAVADDQLALAAASESAGFKWLAPYTGSAIAQHWMYEGKHVLIIFDDLTKQA
ncbi:hypothetical protein, partial [Mycobacterium tuberculosis]|uniref:hypothetical protein n=1 Tax=Mycobacterium tuberculosis TaxID=1773 RepID=UPI001F32E2DA